MIYSKNTYILEVLLNIFIKILYCFLYIYKKMKPVKTRYLYVDVHFSVKIKNNCPTITPLDDKIK